MNVLVFPCGSEIGLEVHRSLSKQKDVELIGGSSVDDHGMFVYHNYIGNIPSISEKTCIKHLKSIVKKHAVDFIYPCMDVVLNFLKKHENELGCTVITSEYTTTDICSSKLKTYNFFKDIILTPKIFNVYDDICFPVFSKPAIGASSRNTFKILNSAELAVISSKHPDNLILEYLPGAEYTVDCFTTKAGSLKFVGARKRARISNGISVNTFCVNDIKINEIAHKINCSLKFNGAWFFQVKENSNGEFCLLEIACRFAGSSVIHRMNGINFAYLNLLNEKCNDLEILHNNASIQLDRSLNIRCKTDIIFDNVYVDLDDTIIIKDAVNVDMIKFLYEMINKNKKIILITKHKYNVGETLKKFKININLFDKIIQIDKDDDKSNYITGLSVFIDDSFSERCAVQKTCNIPVFSVDSIEAIL
jgi:hypothetical protein